MFGFRVYEAWATEGPRKTTRLEVGDPIGDGLSLLQRVEWAADTLVPLALRSGLPDLNRPDEWVESETPNRGDPELLVADSQWISSNQLLLHLKYGFHGMYPEAWDRDGAIPLEQRAPTNNFRALLLMPEAGMSGRLVVETIWSTCPVTALTRWLGWAEHEADPKKWMRLRVKQLADRERVLQMARDAESVTARLTQHLPGAPGDGGGIKAKLEVNEKTTYGREQLVAEALRWLESGSDGDYVLRVEEIAGYDHDALDELGLKFNKASIVVVDSNGEKRTFKPDSVRDKFTYTVSEDIQMDDETWVDRVRTTLSGPLSEGTDIQM